MIASLVPSENSSTTNFASAVLRERSTTKLGQSSYPIVEFVLKVKAIMQTPLRACCALSASIIRVAEQIALAVDSANFLRQLARCRSQLVSRAKLERQTKSTPLSIAKNALPDHRLLRLGIPNALYASEEHFRRRQCPQDATLA